MRVFLALFFLSFQFIYADTIDNLLKKAIESDYKLKSLIHQKKAKEYQIEQAKARYKPQISFSSYIGWQQYKPYYGEERTQFLQYYYLALKQPIYKPEILSQIKVSKLYKQVAKLKLEQEKQYIKYLFFNTIFDYIYANEKLNLSKKIKNLTKEKYLFIKKLYEINRIKKEELLNTENEYESAYINYKSAAIDLRLYKKSVSVLLDENVDTLLNFTLNKSVNIDYFPIDYYWWKEKLKNNFEIKEAEKNIEIAKIEIEKRKYQKYPKVDLELSYRYASTSAISVASDDKRAALIIDFPFYQGGYVSALVLEAKELEKAAIMDLKEIKKENKFQLKDNWFSMYKSREKIEGLQKQLFVLEELLRTIKVGEEKKVRTKLDVINAELKILQTKLSLLEEIHNFSVSYVRLLYLTANINNETIKQLKSFLVQN